MKLFKKLAVIMMVTLFGGVPTYSYEQQYITIASTTSTANSGLFDAILPQFMLEKNINVKVIPLGTGQAIKTAENGDADLLIVHHTPSEEKFIADGYADKRYNLMYNQFVLIGPKSDPAKISSSGVIDIKLAFRKIASKKATFISRGDDSGTDKKEKSLWRESGVYTTSPNWYIESGSGMGATINMAVAKNAYTITDKATWVSFQNKGNLKVLVENDPVLFNQYGIIVVSDKKHPHIKTKLANVFLNWMLSPRGQEAINNFTVNGQQLFFANYK
ncbi:MAG: substrate-binding domain-containing protein [Alphaproteobacteria bacterium]